MQKSNPYFSIVFLFMISSCVSVLSKTSDEQAWIQYFNENQTRDEVVQRTVASEAPAVKILRQMLDGLPFRNYSIQAENREAYQAQLVLVFDQAFLRVKNQGIELTKSDYANEQKRFLELRSYEKIIALVEGFHRMFLSGVELRAAKRAVDLSLACEAEIHEESKPHLTQFYPFPGGMTYLPRGVYVCINERWKTEFEQLMIETTERLGIEIKTHEAQDWILRHQVEPIYLKTLSDYFLNKQKQEEASWNEAWGSIRETIDWKRPIEEILMTEVPRLRKTFHYLNLEARLTEASKSKQ